MKVLLLGSSARSVLGITESGGSPHARGQTRRASQEPCLNDAMTITSSPATFTLLTCMHEELRLVGGRVLGVYSRSVWTVSVPHPGWTVSERRGRHSAPQSRARARPELNGPHQRVARGLTRRPFTRRRGRATSRFQVAVVIKLGKSRPIVGELTKRSASSGGWAS